MTAKEYLSQGFHVNKDINEKVLELESLDSEICRCTQSFSDTPPIEHNDNKTEEVFKMGKDTRRNGLFGIKKFVSCS